MDKVYEKLERALECVRARTKFTPRLSLILGSGLGDYADGIAVESEIDYADIIGFPVSTVKGHEGKFIFGRVGGVPVVVMKGRVHYYEGYDISDVVMPVRLMRMMGSEYLFLTNAVGGINPKLAAGDFMLIEDHIMYGVPSPLRGENDERLGIRFPDMSEVYSKNLRSVISKTAEKLNIPLKSGVYIQTGGPQFETPAEIRAYAAWGADVVGMSTACEAVAGRHSGFEVCGVSCVSNLAAGISQNPLTHEEVQETANRVAPYFKKLITASIINIAAQKTN